MITFSYSEEDTIIFADQFAKTLSSGDIVLIYGDLGLGKSVLCRAVIRSLCSDRTMDVPSPTFTLVQTYETPLFQIWHYDLYRLNDPQEIYELGWEDSLSQKGVVLVEWPERLGNIKPKGTIDIFISLSEDSSDKRKVEVKRNAR